MIVKHNKTGDLYLLVNDKCKAKINGEWVDAVAYRGRDKETGKIKCFVREKSDFDSRFTTFCSGIKREVESLNLLDKICILKGIAVEYPGKTIENIIVQLESRIIEM